VIVVDSSALVAVIFEEPDAELFHARMRAEPLLCISAATWLECGIVVGRSRGAAGLSRLDALLDVYDIAIVPFDAAQAALARDAFLRFGKGRHKAGLNFGDCMSYALAKSRNAKLLCKGADFAATDANPA
jgi:ribonuclease VapC